MHIVFYRRTCGIKVVVVVGDLVSVVVELVGDAC